MANRHSYLEIHSFNLRVETKAFDDSDSQAVRSGGGILAWWLECWPSGAESLALRQQPGKTVDIENTFVELKIDRHTFDFELFYSQDPQLLSWVRAF